MKFTLTLEEYEALNDELRTSYTQTGDNFTLDVEGLPITDRSDEVEKLLNALRKEREDHKNDRKDLMEKLASSKVVDKPKADLIVDTKDPTVLALQKQLEKQSDQLEVLLNEKEKLSIDNKQKTIVDKLKSISNGKIVPSAVDDLIRYSGEFNLTDDGNVVTTDGTQANDWFENTLKTKPHWIPKNVSAGAIGGKTTNNANNGVKRYNELMTKPSLDLQESAEALKLAKEIKENSLK